MSYWPSTWGWFDPFAYLWWFWGRCWWFPWLPRRWWAFGWPWWLGFYWPPSPFTPWWTPPVTKEQEASMLEEQARMLEAELEQIRKRLEELRK